MVTKPGGIGGVLQVGTDKKWKGVGTSFKEEREGVGGIGNTRKNKD